MEFVFVAVFLFAAWHTVKHGVPAAGRAIGSGYRSRMLRWEQANPDASRPGQVGAGVANGFAAVRYGPGFAWREFVQAWRDGWAEGRDRYGKPPAVEPTAHVDDDGEMRFGDDPQDPTGVATCPTCKGAAVVDAEPCPACVARQEARNEHHDRQMTDPVDDQPPPDNVRELHPNRRPAANAAASTEGEPVSQIHTATGGDVTNAMANLAEANTVVAEYSESDQDAERDLARDRERLKVVEQWVAVLAANHAPPARLAEVQALVDPAQRRLHAAEVRRGAASARASVAQTVHATASADAQLVGQAVGRWYNPNN